jgi:hypothetical protein
MPLYELTREALNPVPRTTMHEQSYREREDLQRLLRSSISVIGDDLFVLAEEFSQWEDSRRRVDLLALDRNGALVVIELKRTEDGGHMELQAVRYAAMVSTLSFNQAVTAHAKFLKAEAGEAEAAILDFLGATEPPDDFGQSVRIILVSPDFSRELTTAVLWLNSNGLDIRCVRLRPYQLEGRTILEIDQIIPIREAQEYTVRLKEKQEEARQAAASASDWTRYDLTANGQTYSNLWKRNLMWRVVASAAAAGLTLETLTSIIPSRKMFIVDGHLRGDAFHAAAQAGRDASGYVFRPERFFIDDEHLIDIGDKTVAMSKMWGLPSLPLIDKSISAVPSAKISYARTEEAD